MPGDRRIAVAAGSIFGQFGPHWPARQGGLRFRRTVRPHVRRRQANGIVEGRNSSSGSSCDEGRLASRKQPALRSAGDGEEHDARRGSGGNHASPPDDDGCPGTLRQVNRSTADELPARSRRSRALHPLSKRTAQVLDQLPVDAHFTATVRAGLQVDEMRLRARPELFAKRELREELATDPITAHGRAPLPQREHVAPRGAWIEVP